MSEKREWTQEEIDADMAFGDDIDDDELEAAEQLGNCGRLPDGQCLAAGTEWCEFDCIFRSRA